MSLRMTLLAAALATFGATAAHAATQTGTSAEVFAQFAIDQDWVLINGNQTNDWPYWSFAIWATDGGTFNLDTATVEHPWPWGPIPVPGDYNYDYYQLQYGGMQVQGYRLGTRTFEENINLQWDVTASVTLNWTEVDLVVFKGFASSDGEYVAPVELTGAGITAAVPEPGTAGMLLAGLGLLGLAARRKFH